MPLETQIDLFLDARRLAERASGWLLRHRPPSFGIDVAVDEFSSPISTIAANLDTVVTGRVAADIAQRRSSGIDAGCAAELAARAARWPWMHPGFDIVELADREQLPDRTGDDDVLVDVRRVRPVLAVGGDRGAAPLRPLADPGPVSAARRPADRARLADPPRARDRRRLDVGVDGDNQRSVGKAIAMHTEIRRAESFDLTTLSVALRQLRNLTRAAAGCT